MSEPTTKKNNSISKKYLSYQKKNRKELEKRRKELESSISKAKKAIAEYPLASDRRILMKDFSFKKIELETCIAMGEFIEEGITKVVKILGLHSDEGEEIGEKEAKYVVKDAKKEEEEEEEVEGEGEDEEEEMKKSCSKSSKIGIDEEIKGFKPKFSEIISGVSPKKYFNSHPFCAKCRENIEFVRKKRENGSKWKSTELVRWKDVKSESFVNNIFRSEKAEFYDRSLVDEEEEFKSLSRKVKDPALIERIRDEIFKKQQFHVMKEYSRELVRAHVLHPKSKIQLYLRERHIQTDNFKQERCIIPLQKLRQFFPEFSDKHNVRDRKIICIIMNNIMEYVFQNNPDLSISSTPTEEDLVLEKFSFYCHKYRNYFLEENDRIGPWLVVRDIGDRYLMDKSTEEEFSSHGQSFREAIECLKQLRMKYEEIHDPMEVVLILCETCRLIGLCAQRNFTQNSQDHWAFGADNLFPIIYHVVLESRIPRLYSLFQFANVYIRKNDDLYRDFLGERMESIYFMTCVDGIINYMLDHARDFVDKDLKDGRFVEWFIQQLPHKENLEDVKERNEYVFLNFSDILITVSVGKKEEKEETLIVCKFPSLFLFK